MKDGEGDGVERWVASVVKELPDLASAERADIRADLIERFGADETTFDDMCARHGEPKVYGRQLREAMGLAPLPRRLIERRGLLAVVAAVLVVVGVTVWQRATRVPDPYPVRVDPFLFDDDPTAPGAVEQVGSVLQVRVADGASSFISLSVENYGDDPMRIEGVVPGVGFRLDGASISFGGGYPPIWTIDAVAQLDDPDDLIRDVYSYDVADDTYVPLPLVVPPGGRAVVAIRGLFKECQVGVESVRDRLRLDTRVNGEQRIIDGPELVFDLRGCP